MGGDAPPSAIGVIPETTVSPAPETSESAVVPPAGGRSEKNLESTVPASREKPAPEKVKASTKPEKFKTISKEVPPKKTIPPQTMIIAGILVLALLAAAGYFVILPMLSGSSTGTGNVPLVPGSPGTSGTPTAQAATSPARGITLTPGPTQVPPSKLSLVLDAERDPISHLVTVTFKGGAGQYGVSNIQVRFTRSDGQVSTQTFKPASIGSGVTFQGTEKTDRVEATASFYSGEQYKIMDQVFEYQKRNG